MGRSEYMLNICNQIFISNNYFQLLYKVNINGVEIKNVENTNPQSFKDVKVFVGDKFHSACDASYKNFIWKNDGKQKLHVTRDMSFNCMCNRIYHLSIREFSHLSEK